MNESIRKTNAGTNYLTESEEKKLFQTIRSRKGRLARRDYALLKICRGLGLRRGEAIDLNVGDVRDKTHLVVDLRIAKKGATGDLLISQELQDVIRVFVKQKARWGEDISYDAPLFVSRKGNRLSARAVNDVMTKWCREARIDRLTPHALRHTKAQRIMADMIHLDGDKASKKLLFVQKQLRHKSINSSSIYAAPTKEEMDLVAGI